ncbi:MAG TPA: hypothetical protein VHL98_00935 [Microvirga sp.]|jgi:hypothetical protein|nr:hypothetical protein [Microvirga sp.]
MTLPPVEAQPNGSPAARPDPTGIPADAAAPGDALPYQRAVAPGDAPPY